MGDASASAAFATVTAHVQHREDGTCLFHAGSGLIGSCVPLGQRFAQIAARNPTRMFLAERAGEGWRKITYGEAWDITGRLASGLLKTDCSAERPLLIVAGNSIDHALLSLAAMRVGIPIAPVSVAYAAHGTFERLRHVVELSGACAAYVAAEIAPTARAAIAGWGLQLVDPAQLASAPSSAPSPETEAAVGPDTIAKLMFTSGSTGAPKAVINTHRMLWANQAQLAAIWPAVQAKPPILADWLPWNHTFGGNFVFNMALWHGGSLYIDDGRPVPALIGRTLEAMVEAGPTRYFNVPTGYEILLPALEADMDLARRACRNLEFALCAAAALPQTTRDRLSDVFERAAGREVPILGGWGSTETAPCATAIHFDNRLAANIGVPLPGVTIKMVPFDDRYELLVKGPNVTPGYWRSPEATADAFDEEGYYRIGDAGTFVDPERPAAGIMFKGRTSENFKLKTGTWVNVGDLRLAIIDCACPFVRDAVIAGHDRDEIGALLFLDEPACRRCLGLRDDELLAGNDVVRQAIAAALSSHNSAAGGGSRRIDRFLIEATPPSPALGEITDKGYINQRAVLTARAASVNHLYADDAGRVTSSSG